MPHSNKRNIPPNFGHICQSNLETHQAKTDTIATRNSQTTTMVQVLACSQTLMDQAGITSLSI